MELTVEVGFTLGFVFNSGSIGVVLRSFRLRDCLLWVLYEREMVNSKI